ncbi:hypothetical protein Hoch_5706 [Haliangium ochraceum DSM 14365]|uniref:Uncharacterized protein n=2 Tax=Haliangium ochraceum TaxID=80816 RepID=D0LH38_HALO1|nr:hypothetical protein Hoch_5706 [Haliangium ochraceum DSM 14365]
MFRLLSWTSAAIVAGSLALVRWGDRLGTPPGPPVKWERMVVGALLLALAAALALSVSGRKRIPPSWTARGVALVCSLAVVALAFYMRMDAVAMGPGIAADLLGGQGWLWLLVGGSMATGSALGTLALKPPTPPKKPRRRR